MSTREPATQASPVLGRYCLLDTPEARVRLAAASTMASTIAHELSQPLTAAANYMHACASALRGRAGFEDVLAMIEHASRETLKAGEMVRRTRSFIMTGRIAGHRENLRSMIERVAPAFAPAGDADVEMVNKVPGGHFVIADRIHIEQVLSNVVRNAREVLEGRARRRIVIDSLALDKEIVVRIEDEGPGFAEDALERAFEPLFTTKPDGLGLGLAICRTIVEAHGGRIWAQNLKNGGAAISVALPAAAQPSRQPGG